jgi:hypothetical protein
LISCCFQKSIFTTTTTKFPFTAYAKFELLKTLIPIILYLNRGCRGHDRKEVGFTTVIVFNPTFNNISDISWQVEETGVPRENYRPAVSYGQTLSPTTTKFPFTAYAKFELLKTLIPIILYLNRGCRGHDRKEVGFTTTNAISAYHY